MEEMRKEIDVGDWHSNLAYDEWTPLTVAAGSRASARYKVNLIGIQSIWFNWDYFVCWIVSSMLWKKCSMRQWLLMRSFTLSVEAVTADTYLISTYCLLIISFLFVCVCMFVSWICVDDFVFNSFRCLILEVWLGLVWNLKLKSVMVSLLFQTTAW